MIKKTVFLFGVLCFALVGANQALAGGGQKKGGNNECPVDLLDSGKTLDEEFGLGTSEITRCLKRRHKVKLLIQANNYCGKTDANGVCARPYALHNIKNVINDYETTNGMDPGQDYEPGRDYEIAVVVHSGGGVLLLDSDEYHSDPHPKASSNQFAGYVEDLLLKGVKFYFCQNTARGMKVKTHQLIPGVKYVTAGISALADFQSDGWTYVQP